VIPACSIVPLSLRAVCEKNAIMNPVERFQTIADTHYEPLFRFAISLTHSEADARDLVQHAFAIWAAKGQQLRDFSRVRAWLFTTLNREFLAGRRRERRFLHENLDDVAEQLPSHLPQFANHLDAAQVLAALAELDETYRNVVALFYLEDWSYKEISQVLNIPLGTVKSRLARGILQLRRTLFANLTGDLAARRNSGPSFVREPAIAF
jgi:RNA polymerase sigma-70 factor (ECF subfamily)